MTLALTLRLGHGVLRTTRYYLNPSPNNPNPNPNPNLALTLTRSGFRAVVDNFEGVDMLLTPSQSVVFRNIKPEQKAGVEACLKMHRTLTLAL